jgi:hypothetical protein
MMKKILYLVLCLALAIPFFAVAEEDEAISLELNYEAATADYEGTWLLTAAYTAEDGFLEVAPEAIALEITLQVDFGVLVDMEAYIHADVTNLQGTLSFAHDEIDMEDYRCSANYDDFTNFGKNDEGVYASTGAVKFRVRDDDEGLFFDIITGVEIDDMELMDVIGLNADGQLILGYSEDHIQRDAEAEFAYAYIFTKVEAEDAVPAE